MVWRLRAADADTTTNSASPSRRCYLVIITQRLPRRLQPLRDRDMSLGRVSSPSNQPWCGDDETRPVEVQFMRRATSGQDGRGRKTFCLKAILEILNLESRVGAFQFHPHFSSSSSSSHSSSSKKSGAFIKPLRCKQRRYDNTIPALNHFTGVDN